MDFPSTEAFGEPAELVAISKLAKSMNAAPDTVYAVLQAKGVEPAVVVPFSRGFMRQYRVYDIEKPGIAEAIVALKASKKAAKAATASANQGRLMTPEVRAKANATRTSNRVAKDKAELKKLRRFAKLAKELGLA